jgi:glycerophosphoryl diester phosphodiesterase
MASPSSLPWLTERPIAHRGLHDAAQGIVENTPSAVSAAIEGGYGIEVDVQMSADGEAFIFHDGTLDRLTTATGAISRWQSVDLRHITMRGGNDRLWTLPELLALVMKQVPLVIEIKSDWSRSHDRLALRVAELLKSYRGPVLVKSFDPRILKLLRRQVPDLPRGIIGCAFGRTAEWGFLDAGMRFCARNLLHWGITRPHAISWDVKDLPRLSVVVAQRLAQVPLLTWTVRTPSDQTRASIYADQMIFEGFKP